MGCVNAEKILSLSAAQRARTLPFSCLVALVGFVKTKLAQLAQNKPRLLRPFACLAEAKKLSPEKIMQFLNDRPAALANPSLRLLESLRKERTKD